MRKIVSCILGLLAVIAGICFFVANAIPSFDDFHNPEVTRLGAAISVAISWGLPAVAVYMGYRVIRGGFR